MNPSPIPPSDETLSAFLDGALSAEDRRQVEEWLADHADDAARLRAWAADRDALRRHAAALLAEPVPPRLRDLVLGGDARQRGWRQAALIVGLLIAGTALGAGGLWQWQRWHGLHAPQLAAAPAPGSWVQRAAYAHSVYVPEPRHAVEVGAQEDHLARWLTRRIDVPVKLFDLRGQGFDLVGGRLLPDGAGKSAQLMYQDAGGRRVTVYLRKPEDGAATAFRYEQQGDLGLFYWVEDGAGYALVGALPRAQLLALALAIYQQHPGADPAR